MTFQAGGGIDFAVNLVLAQIISPVGQAPFHGLQILVARFYLFLVGMAVRAEGFLMTGGTGKFRSCVIAVFDVEIGRLVIQGAP